MRYYKTEINGNGLVVVCPQSKIGYTYPELFIKLKNPTEVELRSGAKRTMQYLWNDVTTGESLVKESDSYDQWTDDDAVILPAETVCQEVGLNYNGIVKWLDSFCK